jgi:hypothetical protein
MKKHSKHVAPSTSGGWMVKKSGSSRATRTFETQAEAIRYGRALAKKERTELYVHGRDGLIKDKATYRDAGSGRFLKKA